MVTGISGISESSRQELTAWRSLSLSRSQAALAYFCRFRAAIAGTLVLYVVVKIRGLFVVSISLRDRFCAQPIHARIAASQLAKRSE
jgi:hypothetical protein